MTGQEFTAGVHHIAVLVDDLAIAERFYCDVVGLALDRRHFGEDGHMRSIWLNLGHGAILMLELATDKGERQARGLSPGWHMLAFRIRADQRTSLIKHLQTHGIPITGETPHTIYIKDPCGNRVGFSHWPEQS